MTESYILEKLDRGVNVKRLTVDFWRWNNHPIRIKETEEIIKAL